MTKSVDLDAIVARLSRLSAPASADDEGPRAAVAAIFRQHANGGAELFFIRRAERAGDPWSGHIAFPGGRHAPSDETLLHTAIRETREEVGIDLTDVELVTRLPEVPAFTREKRGMLVVVPFVFVLRADVSPSPNYEVADTLWVPFDKLSSGEGRETFHWQWEGKDLELPCIRLEHTEQVLWGMTYRMVQTILDALGPTDDSEGPEGAAIRSGRL